MMAECVPSLVLEIDPRDVVAYNNICAAHAKLAEWDRAIDACEKALAISPNHRLARNNLRWARNGKRQN